MTHPRVFLSHSRDDDEAARDLSQRLRSAGLDVWFDLDDLKPGLAWLPSIEEALASCDVFAVYVGRAGVQRWVGVEVRTALSRSVEDPSFRVIPVLAEGVRPADLPAFLGQYTALDLSHGVDAAVARLAESLDAAPNERPDHPLLAAGEPPYRGLLAFHPEHAHLFFGRDREVGELLEALRHDGFLAVVGDSGSGKSSLVRAGLIPALHGGRFQGSTSWRVAVLRPGEDPFRELAYALPELDEDLSANDRAELIDAAREKLPQGPEHLGNRIAALVPTGVRTLLVVDQFEELFTQTSDPEVRRRFMEALLQTASVQGERPVHVAVTLRADFYSRCWEHPPLTKRISANQYPVCRMEREFLRDVIEKPIVLAGARFEAGLVEAILDDVGDEPGNLPLLEHTLQLLWDRRHGDDLTHKTYDEIGRLRGALARHADEVYEGFGKPQQEVVQRILVDLVQPGEASDDARRRVKKSTLLSRGGDPAVSESTLARLATERLVTTGRDEGEFVEVAHEALVREWGRLRGWLEDDRDFLVWRRRLRDRVREWEDAGRDEAALLRGRPLVEARDWEETRGEELSTQEREFVRLSRRLKERRREEAEKRRKALETALRREAATSNKQIRQARTLGYVAIVALVVVSALGIVASRQWRLARNQTQATNYNLAQVFEERATAALQPNNLNYREAWLYSLVALRQDVGSRRLPLSTGRLLRSDVYAGAFRELWRSPQKSDAMFDVAFSPDGQIMATTSTDNGVQLWDTNGFEEIASFEEHSSFMSHVAFSPDGKAIAFGGFNSNIQLWDMRRREKIANFTESAEAFFSTVFSPDGKLLASICNNNDVHIWDIERREEYPDFVAYLGNVLSAAFSPNGKTIALGNLDNSIRLWDIEKREEFGVLVAHLRSVRSVAFSPDGSLLASGSIGGNIRLWDVQRHEEVANFSGHSEAVSSVLFNPSGDLLASGSFDGSVRLWDVEQRREVAKFPGYPKTVTNIAFSPDGKMLASGFSDRSVRLWDVEQRKEAAGLTGHSGSVSGVVFRDGGNSVSSTDGKEIFTWDVERGEVTAKFTDLSTEVLGISLGLENELLAVDYKNGRLRLQNIEQGKMVAEVTGHLESASGVAFSSDNKLLAFGSEDKSILLWDMGGGVPFAELTGHSGKVLSIAFSPEWRFLASASREDGILLWDVRKKKLLDKLMKYEGSASSVTFSPDGELLAAGFLDGNICVWDIKKREKIDKFTGHSGTISSVAFSSDGKIIASGSLNGVVRFWDMKQRQEIANLPVHYDVTFGPDGNLLTTEQEALVDDAGVRIARQAGYSGFINPVLSSDGRLLALGSWDTSIRLWNVELREETARLMGHSDKVLNIAFSPDGKILASSSWDKSVRFWDIEKHQEIGKLTGSSEYVRSVAFSTDGKLFASGGNDKIVRLWDVTRREEVATLAGHSAPISDIIFRSDGKFLLSRTGDGSLSEIRTWDLTRLRYLEGQPGHVGSFEKIYWASLHLMGYKLQGLKLVRKRRPMYMAPMNDYEFPKPRKYQKLDRPRPPGKDPLEWILENVE